MAAALGTAMAGSMAKDMKMEGNMSGMEVFTEILYIDLTAPPASIFEVPEGVVMQKE
jgi:hypothetical protein